MMTLSFKPPSILDHKVIPLAPLLSSFNVTHGICFLFCLFSYKGLLHMYMDNTKLVFRFLPCVSCLGSPSLFQSTKILHIVPPLLLSPLLVLVFLIISKLGMFFFHGFIHLLSFANTVRTINSSSQQTLHKVSLLNFFPKCTLFIPKKTMKIFTP